MTPLRNSPSKTQRVSKQDSGTGKILGPRENFNGIPRHRSFF